MKFTDKTKKLLKKAGWYEGRQLNIEELKLPYQDYPNNIIEFLKEYGNLEGKCEPNVLLSTTSIDEFFIYPEMDLEYLQNEDEDYGYYSSIIERKLFPIGLYMPDRYYICCDSDGRVYKIGEYCFYVGSNIYEGIENILLTNTLASLQLDEDTGKWWNMDGQYVELP